MPTLTTPQHFRTVQNLPFCYLCGDALKQGQDQNRDHIPPQAIFLKQDRDPLWLPTHLACNSGQSLADEKIGQLIALKNRKVPSDPKNRRLRFRIEEGQGAVVNLDLDGAVWRWVRGFHAALYREPLLHPVAGALVTPFPRGPITDGPLAAEPLRPQHAAFVLAIKKSRLSGTLDRVSSNRGKLLYECVWVQSDNDGPWMCIFAIDVYDWKDLGATDRYPTRGCAGFYTLPTGLRPETAAVGVLSEVDVPNLDPHDPFGP